MTAGAGITLAYDTATVHGGSRSLHITGTLSAAGAVLATTGNCAARNTATKVSFWLRGIRSSVKAMAEYGLVFRLGSATTWYNAGSFLTTVLDTSAAFSYTANGFYLADWTKIVLNLPAGIDTSNYVFEILAQTGPALDICIDDIILE